MAGGISQHFSRREFACKCGCGFDVVDVELITILEDVRNVFGPIKVNSGCRCERHNEEVGGSPSSTHKLGKAADIVALELPTESQYLVYKYLDDKYPDKYGIGKYHGRTHVDSRSEKHRWVG